MEVCAWSMPDGFTLNSQPLHWITGPHSWHNGATQPLAPIQNETKKGSDRTEKVSVEKEQQGREGEKLVAERNLVTGTTKHEENSTRHWITWRMQWATEHARTDRRRITITEDALCCWPLKIAFIPDSKVRTTPMSQVKFDFRVTYVGWFLISFGSLPLETKELVKSR